MGDQWNVGSLYAPLIPLAVFLIYRKHHKTGTDGTVLPRWLAMTCATALPVFTLIVAALMAIF